MKKLGQILTIFFLTMIIVPGPVFAKGNKVEVLSQKGAKAYGEKNYKSAISFYKKAYAEEEISVLLFNIAKCYEKEKDWENAKKYYQEFVVAPDVEKKFREAALKKIKGIEETEDAEEEQRLAKIEREEEKKRKQEEKEKMQQDEEKGTKKPTNSGGSDATLAYVVGGSGIAMLVGGGVFGLLAQSQETTFKSATSTQEKQDAQSSGKTMALVADGMFIAGGIATAVGIYLFASSGSDNDRAPSVGAWFTTTSGGANVRLSF